MGVGGGQTGAGRITLAPLRSPGSPHVGLVGVGVGVAGSGGAGTGERGKKNVLSIGSIIDE